MTIRINRRQFEALLGRSTAAIALSELGLARPARAQLIVVGLGLGLGLAGGLAYALNMLRPVFIEAQALEDATGLPLLGTVSVSNVQERQLVRRRAYVACALSIGLLIVLGVVALKLSLMGVHLAGPNGLV